MTVNIYMFHTIHSPGTKAGSFTYILETEINGKVATLTKTDILEPITENRAELTVLLQALKRLRKECNVLVYGAGAYIRTGCEEWIDKWISAGWKNAKGKDVANMEEWQQFQEFRERYNITICPDTKHSYSDWMQTTTDKREKERKLCTTDSENSTAHKKSMKQQ